MRDGFKDGDLLYASYSAYNFSFDALVAGMNLEEYQAGLSDYVDSLDRVGQKTTIGWLRTYLQAADILPYGSHLS